MFLWRTVQPNTHLISRTFQSSKLQHCKHLTSFVNKGKNSILKMENGDVGIPERISLEDNVQRINNIAKSDVDKREYRGLKLENGLKAIIISDPSSDVAAAALSVEIGHMSDPDYLNGLAHFCEHMLFLGTEKYPNEEEYATYLSKNGGKSNAATFPTLTKYYFKVAPDKLDGALDRFAQFFIAPLFTESATERETNAVNSEHEKNLTTDMWRIQQVQKHLAVEGHPFRKFGTGNLETLREKPKTMNINVRDELIKFHQKWYSANIMSLAVFGKESLDELEELVLSKFSEIENKNVELPVWGPNPYSDDQFGKKVLITPVQDVISLSIEFLTPDLSEYYKSMPDSYISHLIGHEGKNSLLSELRKRGWCNELLTGHKNKPRGFGFFDISIVLTKDGFEHVEDIVELVFQYIKMLQTSEPQKWIFDETCNLHKMGFQFKDADVPITCVSYLVRSMLLYPMEEVLTAPYIQEEWRPDLITDLLKEMVPSKARIIVIGKDLEKLTTKEEPWYKTKYDVVDIPQDVIDRWTNCSLNENFKLPEPNQFIPTNFDLVSQDQGLTKHPTIIFDSPILRVWHKQDTEFLKPRTYSYFEFSNPIANSDPLNCNLTYMLVALFKDHINESLYDADLAGYKVTISNSATGITLKISSYSHKQEVFLKLVLDQLFSFEMDEQRFEIIKDDLMRSLKNFNVDQPYIHAAYYLSLVLTEPAWSKRELLDAMELVTFDRAKLFGKEFLSRLHAECLIYGNVNKQGSMDICDVVKQKLEATKSVQLPLLARQLLHKREYKLTDGDSYLFEINNEIHKSSCAQVYMQCGPQNDAKNIYVELVAQILTEPCYTYLRTKEQLGYIVYSGSRKVNGAIGIRVFAQSSKHPTYVEEKIDGFLTDMVTQIREMPVEEFEKHKESLTTFKLEKPKMMNSQFNIYQIEICPALYHFERNKSEVAILKTITKEELLAFYEKYIAPGSPTRHVLSVHVVSTANDTDGAETNETLDSIRPEVIEKHKKINDLSQFKASKELYPIARPFLDIRAKGARSKL